MTTSAPGELAFPGAFCVFSWILLLVGCGLGAVLLHWYQQNRTGEDDTMEQNFELNKQAFGAFLARCGGKRAGRRRTLRSGCTFQIRPSVSGSGG